MAGLPTIKAALDDGTGTFPYDITAYVRMVEGVQFSRGRGDRLSSPQAGQLTLTLDNADGRFTVGSVTYNVAADQKIRLTSTAPVAATLFTGYVQQWPVAWPGGGDTFALASITAIDVQARLQRRTISNVIAEEYLRDSPSLLYPLGEAQDFTTAGNVVSGRSDVLTVTQAGSGGTLTFGAGTGPGTDGLSAPTFAPVDSSNGKYLRGPITTPLTAAGDLHLEMECFFSTSSATDQTMIQIRRGNTFLTSDDSFSLTIGSTGLVQAAIAAGGVIANCVTAGSKADGLTHHAVAKVTISSTQVTVSVIVDGTLTTGGPQTYPYVSGGVPYFPSFDTLYVGGAPGQLMTGTIAQVAISKQTTTATTTARFQDHYTAGANGFTGTATGSRITRLAAYAAAGVTTSGDAGMVQPGFADFTGSSIWDQIQKMAEAEGGIAYVAGDGTVKLRDKNNSLPATSPSFTTTANQVAPNTAPVVDMQGVINYATANRANGPQQVAADTASILAHERYPNDKTYTVATDDEALYRAQWLVNTRKDPFPRVPSLVLDVLTMSSVDQSSVLALDVGSTVRVTGWPSQSPTGSSADFVIEGFTMTISRDEWTLNANVTYAAPIHGWVLDDATFGVLDSTTRLYV